MNDIRNAGFTLRAPQTERSVACELNDEFTLPDYLPPIGRVIAASGTAALPSRYVGQGTLELAGAVRFRLLYEAAPDADAPIAGAGEGNAPLGELWCAELVSEYDTGIPLGGGAEEDAPAGGASAVFLASADVGAVSARVTAPRRVTLRSRVNLRTCVYADRSCGCTLRGEVPGESVRLLSGRVRTGTVVSGTSAAVALHDTLRREEAAAVGGELRVVSARGRVLISEAAMAGGGAACRGEVTVELLLVGDGEGCRPVTVTRRMPLTAEVPFDTPFPDGFSLTGVCGWGRCTSVAASVEDGNVVCDVTAVVSAAAVGCGSAEYLRDAFSCVRKSETATAELRAEHPVLCTNLNFSVSGGEELRADGVSFRVTDADACVLPESVTCGTDGGRVTVSGKLRACVLLDDGTSFAAREFEIPFRYAGNPGEAAGECEVRADVTVAGCRARTEGDRAVCDCELALALTVWETERVTTVREVNFTAPRTGDTASELIVCYPTADDTLWSVAKRYGRDPAATAADNGLDPDAPEVPLSSAGVKYLLLA